MSSLKLFVLLLLAAQSALASFLCSDLCSPNGCSGVLDSQCTSCPSNWILGSNTCTLDTSSGYQLIAKSSDMTGGSSSITILPSTTTHTCGDYIYYGLHECNINLSISLPSGISIAHYEIQVIVWVILFDDNTWQTTNNIYITFGSNQVGRIMNSFDGQISACDGITQTYYRYAAGFPHINSTGTSITIDISNDQTDLSCKWGFKQVMILAKTCHSYCTECYNSIATACYSCISSMYLSGNTCSSTCLTGYGIITGTKICVLCDLTCIACSQNSTYCSSCTLTGTNIAYLYNSACISACPTGTFTTTNPNICNNCDPKCISCSVNSTYCSSCTLTGGSIAYLHNSACLVSCPTGTFTSANPNICISCDVKCISCSINSTYCSSCTLTGANKAYLYNSVCYANCPTATYPSVSPNICTNCDQKCISCLQASDNCSSCTTSGTYQSFLDYRVTSYTLCTSICASGYFANTVNHQCDPCTSNCLTCEGTSSNCLSCVTGYYWLNFVCYSTCPNSYFNDVANCTACDPQCTICNLSPTNCTVCTSTSYLLNFTCYSVCPDPYYADSTSSNICLPCNTACAACTGPSNTVCSSCSANYTLTVTTCDNICQTGFGISSTPGICIACGTYCTGCYFSSTNCTSCVSSPTQYYLLGINGTASCQTDCPIGYFINTTSMSCIICPIGCIDCSSKTFCYTCKPTYLYYKNYCWKPCPAGSYQFNSTNCSPCDNQCRTCTTGPSNCTSCQSTGQYKSYLLYNACFLVCPITFYGFTNQICQKCNTFCVRCFGGLASNCTQCAYPYVLSGTTCASSCLAEYGVTNDVQRCVKCNNTCKTCAYISTNCSTCQTNGTYAAYLFSNTTLGYSQCLMICPSGTAAISSTRQCLACISICTTCANSVSQCLSCISGYGVLNKKCYSPCPNGYYLSGGICKACSPYCSICNTTNTNCSICILNGTYKAYLLNSSCLSTCSTGYYPSQAPNICNLCNIAICVSCVGSPDNCTYCQSGYYLYNNTCLLVCPYQFAGFNDTRTCNKTSVLLSLSMKFIDNSNQKITIDLNFTYDLDQANFPKESFQNISFNDPTLSLDNFTVTYTWTSSHSYQILLNPSGQIFIDNKTISVMTMKLPQYVHNSSLGIPFSVQVYSQSSSLTWFLLKGREWTNLELSIMSSLSDTSNSIQSFTALPVIQQFNKAGFLSWILPGAQLTSASLLIKSVPAKNCYSGARFWGNFVFFQVPEWQKNREKTKYVVGNSADTLTQNSRLLSQNRNTLEVQSIYWRFNRTGFTTFFIFDCYMQILLIVISWILIIIAKKLQKKAKKSIISKLYSLFHSLHQITIFYLTLGLVLEIFYFDLNSSVRIASLVACVLFNLYYLIYQLYIYYDLLKYPLLQLWSVQYRQIAKKYGYYLKNIRYDEYEDIEKWSPIHFFRPYNYHIVSFYKKYLMILAVAIFYDYPTYAAGALVCIQIFELVRFCISWPFASKARNINRLCLQITILVFFLTVFLQTLYIQEIAHNNIKTISSAANSFYLVGWIGFVCIFIFNISFFVIFVYDICCFFTRSNSQEMRMIRRDFYYEKIVKYQNCNDLQANEQMLDSWVVKGDLNQNWIEDREDSTPSVDILVEKYIVNKMGQDGFTVQVEKSVQIQLKHPHSTVSKQKIKVKQQIQGTIALTKSISHNFFMIIKAIFQEYDPIFQADFLTIKTIAKIQCNKYKPDESINFSEEPHTQILILKYPFDKKKTIKLATPLRGFPINPELFNPLIYDKTLNTRYLY